MMLAKSSKAVAGEYLRFVWRVYRPLFCSRTAVERDLKAQLQANNTFYLVSITGGYDADVKGERDWEAWEAIVRMKSATPTPYYQAVLANIENFNGSFACSTLNGAFQLASSEKLPDAKPATSAAQTIADATTAQSEIDREKQSDKIDNAVSALKAVAYGAVAVSLAYIAGKLTGLIKTVA